MKSHPPATWRRVRDFVAAFAIGFGLWPAASLPAAEPESPQALAGRVLTSEDQPATGATVTLLFFDGQDYRDLGSTTTAPDGAFRFPEAPTLPPTPLGDRFFQLIAHRAGAGLAVVLADGSPRDIPITLPRPVALSATVKDAAGRPLAGIAVKVEHILWRDTHRSAEIPPLKTAWFTARTDSTGRVTIPDLPAGADVRLAIDDDRFASATPDDAIRWYALGDGPEKIVPEPLIAMPAATISGRLLYENSGQPAGGLRIAITEPDAGGMGYANTDNAGRFTLRRLPPGAYDLNVVFGAELRDWTAAVRRGAIVTAGQQLEGQDLTLIKGALITGKLTAADTREGLAGLTIGVAPKERSFSVRFTTTAADGSYQLRVPAGPKHVYFTGRVPEGFRPPEKEKAEVHAANGETTTVDFAFPRTTAADFVSGKVLDGAGEPVAGARVVMVPTDDWMRTNPETLTNASGGFRLPIPKFEGKSEAVRLLARHAQSGVTAQPVTVRRGQSASLRLQRAGPTTLRGRITNAAGQPIVGAEVRASCYLGAFSGANLQVETDAQGRYHFEALWPGINYDVSAAAKGFGSDEVQDLILEPGATRDVPDLALADANMSITGKIVDPGNRPVPGVKIMARGNGVDASATSDAAGAFRLENLTAGWLSLTLVRHERIYEDAKRTKAGSTDVIVEVPDSPGRPLDAPSPTPKPLPTHLVGKTAPPLTIEPGSWVGSALPDDLATALKGKVVLLDFWALECGGCIDGLPNIEAFWKENKARGLQVVGIGSRRHPVEEVREFLERRKLAVTYPLARDARKPGTNAAYGVPLYPCYAVIDRAGRLAYLGHEWPEARAKATALLATESR